jgi:hypothetical protein
MYMYNLVLQTLFVLPGAHVGEPAGSARVRSDPPVGGEPLNDLWSNLCGAHRRYVGGSTGTRRAHCSGAYIEVVDRFRTSRRDGCLAVD